MKVKDVYRRAVLGADAEETLAECAVRMHNRAVGSLAVYRDGRLVGIFTERDLVRAVAEGADPTSTTAARFMTASPATITPETEMIGAAWIMAKLGTRHLPVTDVSGHVMGMLSARDLLAVLAEIQTGFIRSGGT